MNKQLSHVLYVVLGLVLAALFVMTVIASAGGEPWGGTVTVVVLLLLGLAIVISLVAFNPRKGAYSIGFYLAHLGIVAFLAGSLIYAVGGYSVTVAVPNGGSVTPMLEYQMVQMGLTSDQIAGLKGYYNQIPGGEIDETTGKKRPVDLGFNLRIIDFVTEYYDEAEQNVKRYEATVELLYPDGKKETRTLAVNRTLRVNGWKLYLMDVWVDEVYGYEKVHVTFKRDPTEWLSTFGIIIIILGTFLMCFGKSRSGTGKRRPVPLATGGGKGGGRR
jgi:hypothetical protein